MSYHFAHGPRQKYLVGEFAGTHLKELEAASGPKMKEFLDKGVADEKLIKEIIQELGEKPELVYDEKEILRKFKRCKPPVIVL
jgi:hypothetical protein